MHPPLPPQHTRCVCQPHRHRHLQTSSCSIPDKTQLLVYCLNRKVTGGSDTTLISAMDTGILANLVALLEMTKDRIGAQHNPVRPSGTALSPAARETCMDKRRSLWLHLPSLIRHCDAAAGEISWNGAAAAAVWLLHGIILSAEEMGIVVGCEAGIEPAVAILQVGQLPPGTRHRVSPVNPVAGSTSARWKMSTHEGCFVSTQADDPDLRFAVISFLGVLAEASDANCVRIVRAGAMPAISSMV